MVALKTSKPIKQPESFEFSKENKKRVKDIIAKYPKGRQRSATIPLLDLASNQALFLFLR